MDVNVRELSLNGDVFYTFGINRINGLLPVYSMECQSYTIRLNQFNIIHVHGDIDNVLFYYYWKKN